MDSDQIENFMKQDEMISKIFHGVYPIDLIPNDLPRPSIIVFNQDKSTGMGTHWIVLHYKEDNMTEHFDSIGKKPMIYIHNLLISKNMSYMYNNKTLQNYGTNTCALFCLFYSFYSCRKVSFQHIMTMFSDNLLSNESIVIKFFLDNFQSVDKDIDRSGIHSSSEY